MVEEEEGEGLLFVGWEEEIVCAEKGKRMINYYLKKHNSGESVLAVQGFEKTARHMTYSLIDDFADEFGTTCDVTHGTKWYAKRDLLDWLSSLVSDHRSRLQKSNYDLAGPIHDQTYGFRGHLISQLPEMQPRNFKAKKSHMVWNGVSWTCTKKLKHYRSLSRNGVEIRVQSFVFIMAAEGARYVAYLEDMYEDKKTQKKARVRWFHCAEELSGVEPQLNVHTREVLITPQVQVIRAECIEGPASVLTPRHYEQCVAVLPHSILCRIHMCFRQLKSNVIKPFSITNLQGYSSQPVLSCINLPVVTKNKTELCKSGEDKPENTTMWDVKRGHKRKRLDRKKKGQAQGKDHIGLCRKQNELDRPETSPSALGSELPKVLPPYPKLKIKLSGRLLKHGKSYRSQPDLSSSFKINDEIELLCQDSGIRGCWFKCKVLAVSRKCLRVEYDDLQDSDNAGNLQEWVASSKIAAPDKLGMRCTGRLTTRPRPPEDTGECNLEVGAPVDVWWHDGWWEGVVITANVFPTDHLQIYLPGEDKYVTVEKLHVRTARDWVNGSWVDAKRKPDILSCISVKESLKLRDDGEQNKNGST